MLDIDFLYEQTNTSIKKKHQKKTVIENPILYSIGIPKITILLDTLLTDNQLWTFNQFIEKAGLVNNYQILFPLKFKPKDSDCEKQVVDFYTKNKQDLIKYIPQWSKVITLGRSLYSITESDDLIVEGFKDTLLWNTSFFAPEYKCQIFPIDGFKDCVFKDNPEKKFAKIQFELCMKYEIKPRRILPPQRIFLDSKEETNTFLKSWIGKDVKMAWDLETKGLNPWAKDARILIFICSFDGETGYRLNWENVDIDLFNQFIKGKKGILANGKFDFRFVYNNGIKIENLYLYHDTINASHVINEIQRNGLKSDSWLYTDYGGYDKKLDRYKEKFPMCKNDYSLIRKSLLDEYGVDDAIQTFRIYEKQIEVIRELDSKYPLDNGWSLERYFYEVVVPSINMYFEVEVNGVYINIDELRLVEKEIIDDIRQLRNKVYKAFQITPEEVNIDSGEQLGKLIESKGWGIQGRSKKGFPLTKATYLNRWLKEGHGEIQTIIDLREKQILYKTFIGSEKEDLDNMDFIESYFDNESEEEDIKLADGIWKHLVYHSEDNSYRVHPTFAVMLADSHRNKCRNPNLQNQPSHGEKAELIRRIFCPPSEDYYISSDDFSGLQLRIGAIFSGDKTMENIFVNLGGDMHSITAQGVLQRDVTVEEFLKHKKDKYANVRFNAKKINFGLLFGSSAFSFASSVIMDEWSFDETKDYIIKHGLGKRQYTKYVKITEDKDYVGIDNILDDDEKESIFTNVGDPEKFSYAWAVAEDLRIKFFKTYPELYNFIEQRPILSAELGYSRSIHGSFRRLPYLFFNYYNGTCNKKAIRGSHLKNQKNISINSPVQNFESVLVNRWLLKVHKNIKENNLKSKMFTQIHDAGDFYIHKDEPKELLTFIKKTGEMHYPEYGKIPMEIEGNVSDYWGTYKTTEWDEEKQKEVSSWELWDVNAKDWKGFIDAK